MESVQDRKQGDATVGIVRVATALLSLLSYLKSSILKIGHLSYLKSYFSAVVHLQHFYSIK